MTEQEHATRVGAGGRIEWTNHRDKHGDLVAPTADDLARLGAERYAAYQQKREADRKKRATEAADERRFQAFKRTLIASGGAPGDARKAYAEMKRDEGAKTTRQAEEEARVAQRSATMGAI